MSSLQGYVTVSYAALVREFGDPGGPHDPEKSHVEWCLESLYVGTVTIYDYGQMHECDGNWHIVMAEPIEWHVGGRDRAAADWVAQRLWVDPHYPAHAGCCGPELMPWWIEERREAEQERHEAAHEAEQVVAVSPDAVPPDAAADPEPSELPQRPSAQIPLIGP